MNPELRQTLHTISRNLESANETAQENIYTFSQNYVDPCFASIKASVQACIAPCFPPRDDRLRRRRARSRGRAELSFDFYDDWEDDEESNNSFGGWGNDELDRLLAGNHQRDGKDQPQRQRTMNYGTRPRRKSTHLPSEPQSDPTVIPSSSYLGFLERLPWKLGGKGLRYKPSAADLQEHLGGGWRRDGEAEPLLEQSDESEVERSRTKHTRQRSGTATSRSTTHSLSSRGDLIPSDEEEDAVPLDDEFSMMLERRTTGAASDDHSSGKSRSGRRPRASQISTRTVSSKSAKSLPRSAKSTSRKSTLNNEMEASAVPQPTSMTDLKVENEQVREEEENDVVRQREAALMLAVSKGLADTGLPPENASVAEVKDPETVKEVEMPHNAELIARETTSDSGEEGDEIHPPRPKSSDGGKTTSHSKREAPTSADELT